MPRLYAMLVIMDTLWLIILSLWIMLTHTREGQHHEDC